MSKEERAARTHARFSPSKLDSLSKCIRFDYRRTETTDTAADEGTMLHYAMETGNLEGLTAEQATACQSALDYAAGIRIDIKPENCWEATEPRLVLKDLTFGNADRVIFDAGTATLHVVDYKFIRVEGDHAFQIQTYAAAAVEMLSSDGGLGLNRGPEHSVLKNTRVLHVVTHVVAPRLDGGTEREEFDDPEGLVRTVRGRVAALYSVIDDPFNPPNPEYPELCAKCSRASRCPAVNQAVVLAAPKLGLPMPEVFDMGSQVSERDRGLAQQLAGLFVNWAEQVKEKNLEYAQAGGTIPGYKLSNGSSGFKVPRESTPRASEILAAAGVPEELRLSSMTLSVPELAKQLAQVTTDSEDAWKAKICGMLQDLGKVSTYQCLRKEGKKAKKELGA